MSITVNGKTYRGSSVEIRNGQVIIDGKKQDGEALSGIVEIRVTGTLASLECDGAVNCENVEGNVSAGGSVNCGSVSGSVSAGGSVNCNGVGGSINAGGSVRTR